MIGVALPGLGAAAAWRGAARRLASHRIPADAVDWSGGAGLFAAAPLPAADGPHPVTAPRDFPALADHVLCHRDPAAPALAYRALLRHQDDRAALANPADPLTRDLALMAKAVRRDIHKMHAFVRFRELPGAGGRRAFGAWFEPGHAILEAAAPFFARRFADMDWTIATPQGVARFHGGALAFAPPGPRPDLPADASEALWATYFAHIFNPARVKTRAMLSEMPRRYWRNLPETRAIPGMLAQAEARVAAMRAALPGPAPAFAARVLDRQAPLPQAAPESEPADLAAAARAAGACDRCALCAAATQTVWGEGDPQAPLMIVGEQPGDAEDLAGRPFVGPAGRLLREMLPEDARAWLTNAVKHFKFVPRGGRRLHHSPGRDEIGRCRPWLDLERRLVAPRATLALGASAAWALTGDARPLRDRRGRWEAARDGGPVLPTWHPSHILRLPAAAAARARADLAADLAAALAAARDPGFQPVEIPRGEAAGRGAEPPSAAATRRSR